MDSLAFTDLFTLVSPFLFFSSFFLLFVLILFFSDQSPLLILATDAPFQNIHSPTSQLIFTDTLVPPAILLTERTPRYTYFLSGHELRFWSTRRPAPRSNVPLSSPSYRRTSKNDHHIFKNRGVASEIKITLDSARHRCSSSSSGLLKRQYCLTLPRAEPVRILLSRNHSGCTMRVRCPRINTTFTLYAEKITRPVML